MRRTHVQLAEFLASGGQMPDRREWNVEEMLKGSGLEHLVQPKSYCEVWLFSWKCFAISERASSMNFGKVPVRIA